MNIFILDPNPVIAASYHCDQHLSKMILESAQMLSTWAYTAFPKVRPHIYKPAYPKHPCTIWIQQSTDNRIWTILLCRALEEIRLTNGMNPHSSMEIIEAVQDCIGHDDFPELFCTPESFALAMPAFIKLKMSLSAVQKYQEYYRYKHSQWLKIKGPRAGMSFTGPGRTVPEFMKDLEGVRS